ncbi:MAG TPA: hypothetical protein VND54_01630 [Candidatus Saccharimonadales bacterium]|nr:hypothetical protein [Candidatus Saccharimonadales bacterium]
MLRRLGALPATALFRRREHSSPPARAASGIACTMRGCSNHTAELCAYRDRRERSCAAMICPAHRISLGGVSYCRRHAGTVQAIGELARDRSGHPDVDDRAPSLVDWIGRDLDKDIRRLLARAARPGESVIADEVTRLAHDFHRNARWERSWRLVEHTGPILNVTLHVAEDDDSLVHVRVGTETVADGVPPWIARRREGQDVEAAIDISQRRLFYRYLEATISEAVARFRDRSDRIDR